ncbi:MAG: hypothetical protein RI894_1530 [Bacteroidota bacterium]|jgi:hypothetical protein
MSIQEEQLQALSDIRTMMNRSAKFLSLSGLSGIAAGICALIGAAAVPLYLGVTPFDNFFDVHISNSRHTIEEITVFFIADALTVLVVALAIGAFFTRRKAHLRGESAFDHTSIQLAFNLAIPLGAGGLFCFILLYHGFVGLVAPSLLLFYGFSLLHASKFTLDDVRYLGICEMILGLISAVFIGYGLLFWTIGFGVLHIVYGAVMYYKYER